jgi:hypothetical protein
MNDHLKEYALGTLAALIWFALCGGTGLLLGHFRDGPAVLFTLGGFGLVIFFINFWTIVTGDSDDEKMSSGPLVLTVVLLLGMAVGLGLAGGVPIGPGRQVDGTVMDARCTPSGESGCTVEYRISVTASEQDLGWFTCASGDELQIGDHTPVVFDPDERLAPDVGPCSQRPLLSFSTGVYAVAIVLTPLTYLGIWGIRRRRARTR